MQREPYDCTQPLTVTSKPSSSSAKYCTMSLRSASPCTSTSRPNSSWRSMTVLISAFIACSYAASSISPLAHAARALRISAVCGNEPMVVVASSGRWKRASCAATRTEYGARSMSADVTASSAARTSARLVPGCALREASARRASPSARTRRHRRGPSPGCRPRRPSRRRRRATRSALRRGAPHPAGCGERGTATSRCRSRRRRHERQPRRPWRALRRGRCARCCGRQRRRRRSARP